MKKEVIHTLQDIALYAGVSKAEVMDTLELQAVQATHACGRVWGHQRRANTSTKCWGLVISEQGEAKMSSVYKSAWVDIDLCITSLLSCCNSVIFFASQDTIRLTDPEHLSFH